MTHVKGYDKAAAQWEAQCPPEGPEETGDCKHKWKFLGIADGDQYYKCRLCGLEEIG